MLNERRSFAWLLGLLLVAASLWVVVFTQPQASGFFELHVLDIGQGDAILVGTPTGRHLLVDGGEGAAIIPALDGVLPITNRRLDLIVASHNHSDHIGGLVEVVKRYPIEAAWLSGAIHTSSTYRRLLEGIKAADVPTQSVRAGTSKGIDGAIVSVIYPLRDVTGDRPENQHDANVVLTVRYGSVVVVLTGDMEADHEAELIASGWRPCPDSSTPTSCQVVLKVAHHGSHTSTTQGWLDLLKPQLALISVGEGNSYGHPAPAVLERLEAALIPVLRTDEQGTIRVTSDGRSFWTRTEK